MMRCCGTLYETKYNQQRINFNFFCIFLHSFFSVEIVITVRNMNSAYNRNYRMPKQHVHYQTCGVDFIPFNWD